MTSRVYLAAPYHRRSELQDYARRLEYAGIEVTARWLDGLHDHLVDTTDDVDVRGSWATEDIEDIERADALLVFPLPTRANRSARGGVHVELGIALALGKRVIAVGGRPNVFYCLPRVEVVQTFEDAWALLVSPPKQEEAPE